MNCVPDMIRNQRRYSGKKKEPKPKLFGLDIFGWGGGLPHEGVGAKKFGMSFEPRETKIAGRDRGRSKSQRKQISVHFSVLEKARKIGKGQKKNKKISKKKGLEGQGY